MSQYDVPDPEDLLECPYDNTHMVRAKRFPYHLMKCRKNYTGKDFANCPFNARHEMPKPELRYHVATCKDRVMLSRDLVYAQDKNQYPRHSYASDWEPPKSSEDWERDIPVVPRIGVDPKYLQDKNIIRNLSGMTPAQKKAFHQKVLLNFERKKQGLPPLDEDEPIKIEPEQPTSLRLPKEKPQVLQERRKQQQQNPQQPNVFLYSMAMAGIGRGRGGSSVSSSTATWARPPSQALGGVQNMVNQNKEVDDGNFSYAESQSSVFHGMAGIGRGVSMEQPSMVPRMRRGVGRGFSFDIPDDAPSFVVPKTQPANLIRLDEGLDSAGDNDSSSTEDVEEMNRNSIKKLQKKLRQINLLEEKKSMGQMLNKEEEEKLSRKEELMTEVQSLCQTFGQDFRGFT